MTASPSSQTLVVALYYAVFAAGVRAVQSIDAMAVIYMSITVIWLIIAFRQSGTNCYTGKATICRALNA